MTLRKVGELFLEAKPFPEMLSVITDPNLEVFQVTTDLSAAGNTRFGFFSADGSRFFFARHRDNSGLGNGVQYEMCEVNDGFALRLLTGDDDPRMPVVSADGRYFYYFANPPANSGAGVTLKRVDLTTFAVEQLAVYDAPVEGVGWKLRAVSSRPGSMRADGQMFCAGGECETPDGETYFTPIFVNLNTLAMHGFEWTPWSWRVGGTYFPGTDPRYMNRLSMGRVGISERWDPPEYHYVTHTYGYSAQHVVDEYGHILGTLPFGGVREENTSHTCWRGANYEMLSHSGRFDTAPHWRGTIMCAAPVDCPPDEYTLGRNIPGARRVELTRKFTRPDVCHISWHDNGINGVCDTEGWQGRGTPCLQGPSAFLYLATLIENGTEDPYLVTKYLLHPRSSWDGAFTENCPVLSPDLRTVFFNSDWTCTLGQPQVFAVRGFEFLHG